MKKLVYPGSFDPVTNGHLDIIHRAVDICDELTVAVSNNPRKIHLFNIEERKYFLEVLTKNLPTITVKVFNKLLVDFLQENNLKFIVRGLRAVTDFEMEFQMALVNKKIGYNIETLFLVSSTEYSFLSSSIIKEVASFGGCVKDFVPSIVEEGLKRKFFENK